MTQRKIIVAGVSSAGKSTFIADNLRPELARHHSHTPVEVLFGGKLVKQFGLQRGKPAQSGVGFHLGSAPISIVHYNLLISLAQDPTLATFDVMDEPLCHALLAHATDYDLYLCYAPDRIIDARICQRSCIEPVLSHAQTPYPVARVRDHFQRVDQRKLVLEFGRAFENHSRSISIVHSGQDRVSLLSWDEFVSARPSERLEALLIASG